MGTANCISKIVRTKLSQIGPKFSKVCTPKVDDVCLVNQILSNLRKIYVLVAMNLRITGEKYLY